MNCFEFIKMRKYYNEKDKSKRYLNLLLELKSSVLL